MQPDIDKDKAIMVSIADMDFKFSQSIYKQLMEFNGEKVHFGYPVAKNSAWKALRDWIHNRYVDEEI